MKVHHNQDSAILTLENGVTLLITEKGGLHMLFVGIEHNTLKINDLNMRNFLIVDLKPCLRTPNEKFCDFLKGSRTLEEVNDFLKDLAKELDLKDLYDNWRKNMEDNIIQKTAFAHVWTVNNMPTLIGDPRWLRLVADNL